MDPFSITVGAAALAHLATKIAATLKDTYQAYHSAPKDILEIADQITLVAGLVDVFAKSIDGPGRKFPKTFQEHATNLVCQCETILKEIQRMIPNGSARSVNTESLRYAFGNKKRIEKQQTALKGVQHMFMFMTTCYMYSLPQEAQEAQKGLKGQEVEASAAPIGSFHGVMTHVPIQISMAQHSGGSPTVAYEATLTLRPAPQVPSRSYDNESFAKQKASGRESSHTKVSHAGQGRETERSMLANMRRSPYFSLALLQLPLQLRGKEERRDERKESASYQRGREGVGSNSAFELPSAQEATEEVDNLLSNWFDDNNNSFIDDMVDKSYPVSHTDSEAEDQDNDTNSDLLPVTESPESAPQSLPVTQWVCDGCEQKSWKVDRENFMALMRFKCRICSDFDFCGSCYLSQGTVRHPHARSSFVMDCMV